MSTVKDDYRLDWILCEGDTIQTADATYTITGEPIGMGGSSVLYPASKTGSYLEYAIKECFPATPAVYRRINGVIQTADPDDELNQAQIKRYRELLFNERKLGQEIRNTTIRAVSVWDELIPISITTSGKVFHEVSGGIFSVLERMDKKGRFFNELLTDIRNACPLEDRRTTFGLPSIQMTVQIMEQALLALQQVHNAGYYFGDLSGSNLLLTECEPEQNHIGIGHLIDFGSTRKLEPDGFTAPIIDEPVFSTDGFRPFEIRDHEGGALRLGKQADVYSSGCLFLRCVLSPAKIRILGDSPSVGSNALNEVNGKAIGCTGRALQLVNEILDKATKHDPMDRYADASEMLSSIKKLKNEVRPPKNKLGLGLSTLSEGEFLGREDELRKIDQYITQNRNPIIVYGFPGMGKTELVIEYGRRKLSSCQVFFVRFEDSFFQTVVNPIASAFSGYNRFDRTGQLKPQKIIFDEVLQMLCEQSENDILIIDNVDSESIEFSDLCDECFDKLCQIPMHLIITTRTRCDDCGIEVDSLPRSLLYQLFHRFVDFPQHQIDALIDAVEGHTLTVELMARSLKYSIPRLSPDTMLEMLRKGETGIPVLARISTNKDRSRKKQRIEDHLNVLFQINCLDEGKLRLMHNAFCIPNTGMDLELFSSACANFDQDSFLHLIERGWLRLDDDSDILSVHPLIKDITKKACKLSYNDVCNFVDALYDHAQNQPNRVRQIIGVYEHITSTLQMPAAALEQYKQHEYAWAFSEVRTVLGEMPSSMLIKIPYEFCKLVSDSSDTLYVPTWQEGDVLNETFNPTPTAQIILSLIYRDFLVSPQEHALLVERDSAELGRIGESFWGGLDEMFTSFSAENAALEGKGDYAENLYLGKTYRILGKLEASSKFLYMAWSMMDMLELFNDELPQQFNEEYIDTCLTLGNVCVDIQDYEAGYEFFSTAAERESVVGYNNLAWMYLKGYGCNQDFDTAITLFEKAAFHSVSPNIRSNIHLGKLFLGIHPDAKGFIDIDPQRALTYLLKAKSLGSKEVDALISKAKAML